MPVRTWIIVPCYNEESRLDTRTFSAYLASQPDVGFVLVNDGSRDGTLRILWDLERRWPGRGRALALVEVLAQQSERCLDLVEAHR